MLPENKTAYKMIMVERRREACFCPMKNENRDEWLIIDIKRGRPYEAPLSESLKKLNAYLYQSPVIVEDLFTCPLIVVLQQMGHYYSIEPFSFSRRNISFARARFCFGLPAKNLHRSQVSLSVYASFTFDLPKK
jgi:hypothetical protein